MEKIWRLAPPISQEIKENNPDIGPVILQLLYNRGLTNHSQIVDFLQGASLFDPFLFSKMSATCQLIIDHIKNGQKIAIVGDYDADGITASAVLSEILITLKAQVAVWIPSRLGEGYGLNQRIIEEIKATGCGLMITVDNGIKSQKEVAYAQTLGLDVIITDHHTPPASDQLPNCLIINPLLDDNYPYKFLAGVGVAFKLGSALVSLSKLDDNQKEILLNRVLDLVAIGTIGDCVSLLGENRDLVKKGLELINSQPRLGVSQLLKVSGLQLPINEWHIGWQIVPRLNVAGRLDHANSAYQLLISQNSKESQELAERLQDQNINRQNLTRQILFDCSQIAEKEQATKKLLIMVAPNIERQVNSSWPEGIIGLVAGRLADRYHKPTLVICRSENQLKGSARSLENFNIIEALDKAQNCLERYGGHKMAAGFTIKAGCLEKLTEILEKEADQKLLAENLQPQLIIDAQLTGKAIDDKLIDQLEVLSPFGSGNQQPIFVSYGCCVDDLFKMGQQEQHYRMQLNNIIAVAFNGVAQWPNLKIGDKIDVVYHLEWNYFNGRKSMQLKILDIKYENRE